MYCNELRSTLAELRYPIVTDYSKMKCKINKVDSDRYSKCQSKEVNYNDDTILEGLLVSLLLIIARPTPY